VCDKKAISRVPAPHPDCSVMGHLHRAYECDGKRMRACRALDGWMVDDASPWIVDDASRWIVDDASRWIVDDASRWIVDDASLKAALYKSACWRVETET